MIGTSISMQNTEEMLYPSITICEATRGALYVVDGKVFQSMAHYSNWKTGTNYTYTRHYDLTTEQFLGLSTNMPNMSTFTLKPSDIDDRDDICHINSVLRKSCYNN